MYLKHFGFNQPPFAINPDPRFLYLSHKHQEALAHLLYGLDEGGGFVMLSGEVGTGKTTLCFTLLDQMGANVDVALILNPRLSGIELLGALCDELRIPYPQDSSSAKGLIDRLNRFLLDNHARGRRTVAVIDEAQNLSSDVLEQIRLLTNLETPTTKLLQIILVGQPELPELLARRELRQVQQRITARYHLKPLAREETRAYLMHRLAVAGAASDLFTPGAIHAVHRYAGGIPRLINVLCDRALLGAYTLDRRRVDADVVDKAAREISGHRTRRSFDWSPAIAALFVCVAAAGLYTLRTDAHRPDPSTAVAAPPPPANATIAAIAPVEQSTRSAPVPPRAAFGEWIASSGLDEQAAVARLLLQWRPGETEPGAASCGIVENLGFRCLRQRTDWNALLQQNLPCVLAFASPPAGLRYATLIGANEQEARFLDRDGQIARYPVTEVLPNWNGMALVLWRPPGGHDLITRGTSNEGVEWLRRRLTDAGYAPNPLGPVDHFDAALEAELTRFQLASGLQADGVAGPATLARLTGQGAGDQIPALKTH